MCQIGREIENNDIVCLCKLNKLEGYMRVMPVEDKETVLGCFAAFGVLFEVLEPEKRYFPIGPSIF